MNDADRVVLLIRQLGMKQYEFARLIDYSPAYLESVLNQRQPFTKGLRDNVNAFLKRRLEEKRIYEKEMSDTVSTTD